MRRRRSPTQKQPASARDETRAAFINGQQYAHSSLLAGEEVITSGRSIHLTVGATGLEIALAVIRTIRLPVDVLGLLPLP